MILVRERLGYVWFHLAIAMMLVAGSLAMHARDARAELDDHIGALAGAVALGTEGAWTAQLSHGWFMLSNKSDPQSVRYYRAGTDPLDGGTRTVRVNLALRGSSEELSEAGLLFDYDEGGGYMAFTVGADGKLSVWVRESDGLSHAGVAEGVKARMDGSDVLELVQDAKVTKLLINGELAFEIESDQGFTNSYGVIAIGKGRFAFDGLTIEQTAAELAEDDPFPAPGGTEEEDDPFPTPGGDPDVASEPDSEPEVASDPDPTPSQELEELTEEERYVGSVIIGVTFGIFFHELGHALIGELEVPATGPEEDVADEFSAFVLGALFEEEDLLQDPTTVEVLEDVVRYSALLWYYNGKQMASEGSVEPWQDEHSPSLTRFRNSFCIIYGGNPDRYQDLARQVEFPERNQERCKWDYAKRYKAWEKILMPVSRDLGEDSPGDHPPDTPGGKVIVSFDQPTTELGKALMPMFRDSGAVHDIGKELERAIVWPRDFHIVFRDCEEVNAWYDPQEGKITMCYQLIDFFSKVVFKAEQGGQDPQTPQTDPKRTPQTVPKQPEQPTSEDAMAYLLGTWTATIPSGWGAMQASVTYASDGSYQSVFTSSLSTIQILGHLECCPGRKRPDTDQHQSDGLGSYADLRCLWLLHPAVLLSAVYANPDLWTRTPCGRRLGTFRRAG